MSPRRSDQDGGTKLSPQTLIVASLASLTAAIVTSTFWQRGTPITAAITPVIVALASEIYSRPARRITQLSARGAVRTRHAEESSVRERVPTGAPPERGLPVRPPEDSPLGPMRVYRTEQRSSPIRRIHIRAALVTAAVAFAIAAAVLTLPELLFGGSVASHGKTTLFGGHTHKHRSTKPNNGATQTAPTTSTPSPTTTAPAPTTTTPTTTPAQTAPQTTTPAPTPQATPPPQPPRRRRRRRASSAP